MKVKIEIECSNAAFDDLPGVEVSRILEDLAENINFSGLEDGSIHDINGNTVGHIQVEDI